MKKFEQMKKLYNTLNSYIDQYDLSNMMLSGAAADFERLFEMAWKSMKEYLRNYRQIHGAQSGSPKDIIKLAYQDGIIDNEEVWLNILEDRNNDSHHYRKSEAVLYLSKIQSSYLIEIKKLIDYMSNYIDDEKLEENEIPDALVAYCKLHNIPVICFVDELCTKYGYTKYEQLFENWDKVCSDL